MMFDFLKVHTWCSRKEYLWEMTIPQIKIANADFCHNESLASDEEREKRYRDEHMFDSIPIV